MSYSRKSAIDEKRRGFRLATMGTRLRCGVGRRGSGEEGKAEKEEEAGGRSHCCHCRTLRPGPLKKCDVNTYNFDSRLSIIKSRKCSVQCADASTHKLVFSACNFFFGNRLIHLLHFNHRCLCGALRSAKCTCGKLNNVTCFYLLNFTT